MGRDSVGKKLTSESEKENEDENQQCTKSDVITNALTVGISILEMALIKKQLRV